MRKMTKTAAVLAAMSAMTVASASMAFAATDNTAYSAVGKDAVAAGSASGEWEGSNADGWTFTPVDGTKLKGTWAKIDGAWYYFDKDGIMAQEELVYLEGETYYFDSEGRMMANGWLSFDRDSDVLNDYDLDIQENIDDIQNKVFKNVEDAYDTVWMYFDSDGTAMDDEWFKADSGLWYRFDDVIMVCGDYDHLVGTKRYGFGEDGHMFVGWEKNYVDKGITAPNEKSDSWYYYNSDGSKFDADTDNNGFGWKKIEGKWYCFKAAGEADNHQYSAGTLITKTFFTNSKAAEGTSDYYYVDGNGVMATGVVTVDKGAKVIDGTYDWTGTTGKLEKYVSANWDVLFDGSNGKAKKDTWSGTRFYADAKSTKVQTLGLEADFELAPYANASVAVTGNAPDDDTAADIRGALVKNAFISKDEEVYYVDKYGDKLTNSAVQVGYVVAKKVTKNGKDVYSSSTDYTLYLDEDIAETKAADGEIVCKAYVVVNAKGVAYDDVDGGRTASAGSKKYVSTGVDYMDDAQLFYYYNKN